MKMPSVPRWRDSGSALVISLILLAVLTLVATAGMTTSTLELRMASGQQAVLNAFQTADNAIETALNCRRPAPLETLRAADCPAVSVSGEATYELTIERKAASQVLLPEGMSLGSDFIAVEYVIESTATAGRDARVELTQGFHEIGLRE